MCSGVETRENVCQLSGWMKLRDDSIKSKIKMIDVKPKSLKIIETKNPLPSEMSLFVLLGELRWRMIKCKNTIPNETIAKRKWITVKRLNDHEETVWPPNKNPTTSLPKSGITVKRFKITNAAQKLILPETKT